VRAAIITSGIVNFFVVPLHLFLWCTSTSTDMVHATVFLVFFVLQAPSQQDCPHKEEHHDKDEHEDEHDHEAEFHGCDDCAKKVVRSFVRLLRCRMELSPCLFFSLTFYISFLLLYRQFRYQATLTHQLEFGCFRLDWRLLPQLYRWHLVGNCLFDLLSRATGHHTAMATVCHELTQEIAESFLLTKHG
jgi:hypothetical protein